jgi:hypothetical protein
VGAHFPKPFCGQRPQIMTDALPPVLRSHGHVDALEAGWRESGAVNLHHARKRVPTHDDPAQGV